jgi:hypothetical protein
MDKPNRKKTGLRKGMAREGSITERLPVMTSFPTTVENREAGEILSQYSGVYFGEFVHHALTAYVKAILNQHFNGQTIEEFVKNHSETKLLEDVSVAVVGLEFPKSKAA